LGLLDNSETKRQPIGKSGGEKKNSSIGKKLEWGFQLSRSDAKKQ